MAATVCVNCKTRMVKTLTGANVAFIVKSVHPERPYQVWSGDVFTCPTCGAEVVSQWGNGPFWHHFHEGDPPRADITIIEDR